MSNGVIAKERLAPNWETATATESAKAVRRSNQHRVMALRDDQPRRHDRTW